MFLYKFKFLEQKLSLTLKATLSKLHVPQERLHFAKQKLNFRAANTAHKRRGCNEIAQKK